MAVGGGGGWWWIGDSTVAVGRQLEIKGLYWWLWWIEDSTVVVGTLRLCWAMLMVRAPTETVLGNTGVRIVANGDGSCGGVCPRESQAFMLAPCCRSSSTMLISAVWQARYKEHPSRNSSMQCSSLSLHGLSDFELSLPKKKMLVIRFCTNLTSPQDFETYSSDASSPWTALTSVW
ncbi:hypothetical protein HAX54_013524 [Datura stramonium]|uniref:Uncharacterized protein n=1 Tax=Datura stramonium TaxID=4076 RepID=A0ABS8S0A5_DATST|nr:hypothetical protein [Datura stramonium]